MFFAKNFFKKNWAKNIKKTLISREKSNILILIQTK